MLARASCEVRYSESRCAIERVGGGDAKANGEKGPSRDDIVVFVGDDGNGGAVDG